MKSLLNRPVDIAILVYFRFFAGLFLAQELINALAIGKFGEFTTPRLNFSYQFFPWLSPWGMTGMKIHFAVTILAGFLVAVGICYRLSTLVLFLGYTSYFLMEMSEYINHIYLYCLISFWLMWLPLGRKELKDKAPAWMLYLILFHMSIAYFYAGVAKINADWLSGAAMRAFIAAKSAHPLSSIYIHPWAIVLFSWGGMLFDLLIVPGLLWKRSRPWAMGCAVLFHLSNVIMFGLATFPWFSLLVSSMFFDPSWPRKIPGMQHLLKQKTGVRNYELSPLTTSLLTCYLILQLMLPLRHHLYPGDTSWTEQGHMFAWRMMLRTKKGEVKFWIKDKKNGKMTNVNPNHFLTRKQVGSLTGRPELILQFAHYLRDEEKKKGHEVEVYASSKVSLNGKPPRELIKNDVNLAEVQRGLGHYDWINH